MKKPAQIDEAYNSPSMCMVNHPCGHSASLDDSFVKVDKYQCPVCQMEWEIKQGKPIVYSSGYVAPGDRTVEINPQMKLKL